MIIKSEAGKIMELLDGKKIAGEIQEELKASVLRFEGRAPCLTVVLVGENAASEIYIRRKRMACEEVGIKSVLLHLPADTTEEQLIQVIETLNNDPEVDGILVQLPLPKQIRPQSVTIRITPNKDVDGFNPINVGKLLNGETDGFVPCTPLGIKVMLQRAGIEIAGKHVVILGRSNIVGKPMAALLMQNAPGANATVTIVHSRSKDIVPICSSADVLIAAIGQPHYVREEMVKEGAVVVDVGINKIDAHERPSGYQIVGDVDFDNVKAKCSYITPVPGGVGPLTIAMLLQNTLASYQKR